MFEFDADRDEVIARARVAGLGAVVTMGVDLASCRRAIQLAEQYDIVYAAVGFHPYAAAELDSKALSELEGLCAHPKVVAVGEIGLDFHREGLPPRPVQQQTLNRQLDLAASVGLPVAVHDREAHEETLESIRAWVQRSPGYEDRPRGVMHCFSGDVDLAREYVAMGFLVSIAGPITYPKSDQLRQVAREIELESLLIETDCPYLTPAPYRGKRNEPGHVGLVAAAVALERGTELVTVEETIGRNARRLFRLP
ncbi:MAG: TatD family deoxyribonuclease [Chloroflexota bacterium]|nr:MAG: TatD family deoxyribonuclease [Chloroflexota bacterium]